MLFTKLSCLNFSLSEKKVLLAIQFILWKSINNLWFLLILSAKVSNLF